MTIEEAIHCMKSYLPDSEDSYYSCYSCPYYGRDKVDGNVYICNSSEAHKMAIKALEEQLLKK